MRLAILDLGSTSFHSIIADTVAAGHFEIVARKRLLLNIGQAVGASGFIDDVLIVDAIRSVVELERHARAAGAARIAAVATDAFRTATNGRDAAVQIGRAAGLHVDLLEPLSEARLTFRAAAASGLVDGDTSLLIDLGGGSMEIALGNRSELGWATSCGLGVARLTGRFAGADPLTERELRQIRMHVRAVLDPFVGGVHDARPTQLIGSGGTFTALARLSVGAGNRVHGCVLTVAELTALLRTLVDEDLDARVRITGLERYRAAILPTGLLVVLETCNVFGFSAVTVSSWGLREGLILSLADRIGSE